MKSLCIEIFGHQTMPDPLLYLTLQIGDSVYEFDPSSSMQTWYWSYNELVIDYHDVVISLHNKQHLIHHSVQDISNLCYVIDTISFDGREVTDILTTSARYRHHTNGYSSEIVEPYTNVLGCDGCLEFRLITPVFCWWLLDCEF